MNEPDKEKPVIGKAVMWFGLVLAALVVFFGIVRRDRPKEQPPNSVAETPAAGAPAVLLELVAFDWRTQYRYAIVEGQVKNVSGLPLRGVAALASFYTKDGGFITSSDALIDFNPILPGQVSPFKVMATENPAMVKASVEFKYLFGAAIPFERAKKK